MFENWIQTGQHIVLIAIKNIENLLGQFGFIITWILKASKSVS